MTAPLILASASPSRAAMLRNAGIAIDAMPSGVDEDAIKQMLTGRPTPEIAMALAEAKAKVIAQQHPQALVIGADQILVCEGQLFDKPPDMEAAKAHLLALQGRAHHLVTAALVMQGDDVLWQHLNEPQLVMRSLDHAAIDAYLAAAGDVVLTSVGAYQLEGRGAQLFESVDGDFFSILGLPLLPLLSFLRDRQTA